MKKFNKVFLLSMMAVTGSMVAMDSKKPGKPVPTSSETKSTSKPSMGFFEALNDPEVNKFAPGICTQATGTADATDKRLLKLRKKRFSKLRYGSQIANLSAKSTEHRKQAVTADSGRFSKAGLKSATILLKKALQESDFDTAVDSILKIATEYTMKPNITAKDVLKVQKRLKGAVTLADVVSSTPLLFNPLRREGGAISQLNAVIERFNESNSSTK